MYKTFVNHDRWCRKQISLLLFQEMSNQILWVIPSIVLFNFSSLTIQISLDIPISLKTANTTLWDIETIITIIQWRVATKVWLYLCSVDFNKVSSIDHGFLLWYDSLIAEDIRIYTHLLSWTKDLQYVFY